MYKVVLADDEVWALMALKTMIDWAEQGFVIVGEADDGEMALKRISSLEPDLVISDIRMPGLDGLKLLEEIRENKLDTQVLLVSGYTDFEYARQAMLYGCIGYLVKPVDEKELMQYLHKVKSILDARKTKKMSVETKQDSEEQEERGYCSDKVQAQEIVSYIRVNHAQNISLQLLADHFGMSESCISSLIRKKTGKTFGEHLTEARIRNAQELLRTTNDSIETIAQRVGYPDYYYFSKVYKKTTGLSPAAYRRQL
jgi:two-component system response regulator YesN